MKWLLTAVLAAATSSQAIAASPTIVLNQGAGEVVFTFSGRTDDDVTVEWQGSTFTNALPQTQTVSGPTNGAWFFGPRVDSGFGYDLLYALGVSDDGRVADYEFIVSDEFAMNQSEITLNAEWSGSLDDGTFVIDDPQFVSFQVPEPVMGIPALLSLSLLRRVR